MAPSDSVSRLSDCWGDEFAVDPSDDTLRIVSLNVSGLPASPSGVKYQDLHAFILSYNVDILCLTELNQAWNCLPETAHFRQVVRPWFRSVFTKVAYFQDPHLTSSFQRGGTGILVRDQLTGHVCGSGCDPSGLGRWVWVRLRGHNQSHVRVFSAYRPVCNPRDLGSVWNQQQAFFSASHPTRPEDPRQAFLQDLRRNLQAAYDAGDQILLAMDANEPSLWTPVNPISEAFSGLATVDLHLDRHDRATAPATHNRGSRPIDCVLGSTSLSGSASGYLPFGSGPGDHRPLWVDLSTYSIFGTGSRVHQPTSARKLQCRDPRVMKKYQTALRGHYDTHRLATRAFALESQVLASASSSSGLSPSLASEWESLDQLRLQGIREAESNCRKVRTGKIPWTPALSKALAVHRFWDRFYTRSIGRHVSLSYLRRLASQAGISIPSAMPPDEILRHRHAAWLLYKQEKNCAPAARRSFLSTLAMARADAGLESAATGLQNMLRRERQRADAALLRSAFRSSARSGLAQVEVPTGPGTWEDGEWTGAWASHSDRQGMEQGCLAENSRRFRQATGTDLLTRPLVDILGPTGCSFEASYILRSGNTTAVDGLVSPAASLYLGAHKRPSVLVAPRAFDFDFRTPSFSRSWQRMDEFTSSGPSGLHFGHFMANSYDPVLAPVDAAMAHVPALSGYVPERWKKGLNVMLEKKPGVCKVTKLRTILLYEADFNHNNKLMGRAMMRYAEANHLLAPEQYGSRKSHSAVYQALNKVLTYDIARQSRQPIALCSNDAKSCYDRIVHSAAGLAMQRCGVPSNMVESSLRPIQQLRHYIRTTYGDSVISFSADDGELPAHGIGQGNGAGPAIWAVVSTPIFNSMRQRGYGIFIRCPTSGASSDFFFVRYAFVDDTDLVTNDPSPTPSPQAVISRLQQSINFWEESLRASGGALVPSKCHWYLVDYSWSGRAWKLLSSEQAPGDISIRSPSGRRVPIERVDPYMARKTLGIWTAPDGSMTAELQYLQEKVKNWVDKVRVRHLPHHLVWQSLRTGIFKTLEYPLAATTFSLLQCRELCTPLLQVGLSRSHIVRSMPRDVVYGPSEVGGFSLPNLYLEQGLAHVTAFLLFGRSTHSITGCLLRASLEYLHVEVGTSRPPWELPFQPWASCAVSSWAKSLWEFCDMYRIALPKVVRSPLLLRTGDRFLMDAFWDSGIRSASVLATLNQCRLYLRVFSVAEIVTCDGRMILPSAWNGTAPCGRRPRLDTWPRPPPRSSLDWSLWQQCLMQAWVLTPVSGLLLLPWGAGTMLQFGQRSRCFARFLTVCLFPGMRIPGRFTASSQSFGDDDAIMAHSV